MFLIMGVTLYTSRIILNALGVSDYGLYTIVAGIVAMFGFINGAMTSSTQRYLSFDIGKKDDEQLKKTFSTSLIIHFIIGVLVLLVGETLGLWYINYKLVYPEDRTFAVNVVFHFSLLTLFFNIIQVPYNSLILARERMNIYAVVSILEAALKLLIAFVILHYGDDKLILYGGLTFIVTFVIRMIYLIYCRLNFKESKYRFNFDKSYFKEIISFSGWNMFGSFSLVAKNQGVNIVLNIFFGTVINAAYGLAMQVQGAVTQFITSFQSALNPQIVQSYASGNHDRSTNLIFLGSKFSFLLIFLIAFPVITNLELLLELWLGDTVPVHTIQFIKIGLIAILVDSLSGPIMTGIQATGKIKFYQIIVGSFNLITPILVYIFFKNGFSPIIAFQVLLGFSIVSLILRLLFLKALYGIVLTTYFKEVILSVSLIVSLLMGLFAIISRLIAVNSLWTLIICVALFEIFSIIVIFFVGLKRVQRISISKFIERRIAR